MSRNQSLRVSAIDAGMRVVRTDDLGGCLDSHPLPAGPCDDRGSGIGAQIVQLAGASGGDESDYRLTCHWVWQDAGVNHRRLDTAVAAQRIEHTEPMIQCHELGEGRRSVTVGDSFPVSTTTSGPNSVHLEVPSRPL